MALDVGKAQVSSFSWKAFSPKRKRNPAHPLTADDTLALASARFPGTYPHTNNIELSAHPRTSAIPQPPFATPLPPKAQRLLGETGPFPSSSPATYSSTSKAPYLPNKNPHGTTSYAIAAHEWNSSAPQQPHRISAASKRGATPRRLSQSRDSIVYHLSRTDSCPELMNPFQAVPFTNVAQLTGELDAGEVDSLSNLVNRIDDLRVDLTSRHRPTWQERSSRRLGYTFSSAEQIAFGHSFGKLNVDLSDEEEELCLEDAMATYYVDEDIYAGIGPDPDFGGITSACSTPSPHLTTLPPMICITDSDSVPITPTANDFPDTVDYLEHKGNPVLRESAQLCLGSILDLFPSLPSSAIIP